MNFITGLPSSECKTVILIVIDQFSKMEHFIAMPNLPSTTDTVQPVLFHVFQLYGLL